MSKQAVDIKKEEMFPSWWYIRPLPGRDRSPEKWREVLESKVDDKAISIIPINDKGETILSVGINPSSYKGDSEVESITEEIEEDMGNGKKRKLPIYQKIQEEHAKYHEKNEWQIENGGGLDQTRSDILRAFLENRFEDGQKHIEQIKEFIQIDLIPLRTNSVKALDEEKIKKHLDQEALKVNFGLLETYFQKANYVFLGWGSTIEAIEEVSPKLYEECNEELKKLIEQHYDKCYCFWLNKAHVPVHVHGGGFEGARNPQIKNIHAARTLRRLDSPELRYRMSREEVKGESKVFKVGNTYGLQLTQKDIEQLQVQAGDELEKSISSDGRTITFRRKEKIDSKTQKMIDHIFSEDSSLLDALKDK